MNASPPRIVVLDGFTLNPGDLSWKLLEDLGECDIYDRTDPSQTEQRLAEAEVVLTNKVVLNSDLIATLPKLKYIGVLATGYNVVDIDAAQRRDITVANVPSYSTPSVAQTVFAHILNLLQPVASHAAAVNSGRWTSCPDFSFWDSTLTELEGLTLGIVGLGQIGQAVARIADAFGMIVLAVVPSPRPTADYVKLVELDQLFKQSDVISLHCPLTPETEGLVDEARLHLMKQDALLINTSRGPLVDESALAAALNSGAIAGAGLDVLSTEPPSADNPLLSAKNCHITPHFAWATKASRSRLMDTAVANVASYLGGRPQNVVTK